jgi:hypothetical protein
MGFKKTINQLDEKLMEYDRQFREGAVELMRQLGLIQEPAKALKPVRVTNRQRPQRRNQTWR